MFTDSGLNVLAYSVFLLFSPEELAAVGHANKVTLLLLVQSVTKQFARCSFLPLPISMFPHHIDKKFNVEVGQKVSRKALKLHDAESREQRFGFAG